MLFKLFKARASLIERAAPKDSAHGVRAVRCYRCGEHFECSVHAESTSCSHCGGSVRLPDIILDKGHWGGSVQTVGGVHIPEGASVRASLIVASGDILVEGSVHAMLIAGGTVRVTPSGALRGGARCATLVIEPGAIVRGGPFESHSEALGSIDIDEASRAVPGKGPAARMPGGPTPERVELSEPVVVETKPVEMSRRKPGEPRLRVVR